MAYNLKIIKYYNSLEYRFYSSAQSISKRDLGYSDDDTYADFFIDDSKSDIHVRYEREIIDDKVVRYNSVTGEILSDESTEHSILSSLSRTKKSIIEICRANRWDWFVTLTFNPEIVDSYNYDECVRCLTTWLNNLRKRKCANMKYIAVPEKHDSGRYHFHLLMSDIDIDVMQFTLHDRDIYNISCFKYGFSTASMVKSSARVSNYISKYITKDLISDTLNRKRYFCSRNLKRAEVEELLVDRAELEELKLKLEIQGNYFKTINIPNLQNDTVTYINIYDDEVKNDGN